MVVKEKKETQELLAEKFYDSVYEVVLTEKYSRMIDLENKLVFVVAKNTTKAMLRVLFAAKFNAVIKKVNTVNDHTGKKKVIVTFEKKGFASELASKMGIM